MSEYRFSTGSASKSVAGLCFSVIAENRQDALRKARRALECIESVAVDLADTGAFDGRLYFYSRNLKKSDIADVRKRKV